jgi:XRE family transcriptional regulator, regulator of sulfur utilization
MVSNPAGPKHMPMKKLPMALSLLLAGYASAAPAAEPISVTYGPPSQTALLGTTFVDWDSLMPKATPVGQIRTVFDNPTPTLEKFEVHVTTLLPGRVSHGVHHHPWEEMLLIKEGEGDTSINGVLHHVVPGTLVFFASNDPHNFQNTGTAPATYYVINFVTARVHTASGKPANEQAVPGMLPSSVIDCNALPSTPTKTGSRVSVIDSPTLSFVRLESHITTLDAGQSTQTDIVDSGDELFILKAGAIEARVDGVSCRIKADSFFYCAPNSKRTFRNMGTGPATYQVIKVVSEKSPKPVGT